MVGWGAAALGTGLGCSQGSVCGSPDGCGHDGTCEANGYCSFPDPECESGQRYGEDADAAVAGTCVGVPVSSSGSTATAPNTSSPSSSPGDADSTSADSQSTGASGPSTSTGPVDPSTDSDPTQSTGPTESTGSSNERVSDGLLVLYTFEEGVGTAVMDVGGVGAPLDLTIEGSHSWVSDGLELDDAIVRSVVPATKIVDGCQATNEFTVEAWVTPQAPTMEGPARIITLSESSSLRNFTVGQGTFEMLTSVYIGRARTNDASSSDNGVPQVETMPLAMPTLTHLAYVRNTVDYDRLYVDGQAEVEGIRTGDFSTWSPDFEFACGNELTADRPWQGTLHLVAVYDRELSSEEIAQNIDAGL